MLKIGFITPSSGYSYNPFKKHPLVEMYLLTILEEHFGEKVKLSLIDLKGIDSEFLLYHIPENDLFLYSVATTDVNEISKLVKELRNIYPEAKHVAGGPHINLFPDDSSLIFDAIVLGEGEETIIKVVKDIFHSKLQSLYRQERAIDINVYPYSSRKYIPKIAVVDKGYIGGKYSELRATSVIFSRGCPFNCHFCANKKLEFGPTRFRLPKLIEKEIEYLKREYKVEALVLKDDNAIPVALEVAMSFLEAIGRTSLKWRGQSRANGIHPEMVKLAKEAGCVDVSIGIESVSPNVLKIINKKINIEKAKSYIQSLKKEDIGVRLHFIMGLPGEPDDIVKQTLNFIEETQPNYVLLTLFCPTPGSEIYHFPERFGIKLKQSNWEQYKAVFGRFDADEKPNMVFTYNEVTPWGKGKSETQILQEYMEFQSILRERQLNF